MPLSFSDMYYYTKESPACQHLKLSFLHKQENFSHLF
jgi:hypothetical protein